MLLFNDDTTPFDVVVQVLMDVFAMDVTRAASVMSSAHVSGRAVCTLLPLDAAQTKASEAIAASLALGASLRFGTQPD